MNKNIIFMLPALLLWASCSTNQEYKVEPLSVQTEVAAAVTSSISQDYVGTIEEEEAVSVSFTSMGTLKRVLVSEGQRVSAGQLLAEMDDTQARNVLEAAQASCNQAEDAIARYKQLYDKGSLADAKWIEAQSKLDQARASLRVAEKNLQDCRLVAPTSGVIGRKQLSAGSTALPSQAVVTIYKINNVKVKVSIPEREMAAISASTKSQINVPAANVSVAGGRIEKGVVADGLTHTYDIRILVANNNNLLLPGMVCNVSLGLNGDAEAAPANISVPVRCVQQSASGQHFVWVVDNESKARRQLVTLGQTHGNRIDVLSGLQQGTRVITAGYQKVSDGQEVIL